MGSASARQAPRRSNCRLFRGQAADCSRDEIALESDGLLIAMRPKYQKTKAPCNSASDDQQPDDGDVDAVRHGDQADAPRRSMLRSRSSVRSARRARQPAAIAARSRWCRRSSCPSGCPKTCPHNRGNTWRGPCWACGTTRRISSYRRSVGQDSGAERYGMGMNFVMTTSELITTQKAAKSSTHARSRHDARRLGLRHLSRPNSWLHRTPAACASSICRSARSPC